MVLAIVSDELGGPQPEAFALISEWAVSHVELRGLTGGRIPDGDIEEAVRLVGQYAMRVTSISPGVFKCPPEEAKIAAHLERLKATLAVCPRFRCRQIIVFSVQNPTGAAHPPKLVVDALKEAGRLAREAGVRLTVENEPGYTAVGVRALAELVDAVGMDNVGANWDPGNAWPYDPDIDDGPRILGSRVFNVHVKDTAMRGGKRVFDSVGRGDIRWQAQVDGLRAIGYAGPFVVETHCEPGVEKTRASVEAVRALLG